MMPIPHFALGALGAMAGVAACALWVMAGVAAWVAVELIYDAWRRAGWRTAIGKALQVILAAGAMVALAYASR